MDEQGNSGPAGEDAPETMPAKSLSRHVEYKVCEQPDIKFYTDQNGPGSIEGYISTYGNWDRTKEMVAPGAFDPWLAEFEHSGFGTVGHDETGLPIFTINKAWSDDYGLRIKADFHSTPQAQAARTVAQERQERGKSVSFSFGYVVHDDEYVDEGRILKSVQPFEATLANIPANPKALATSVKSAPLAGVPLVEQGEEALAALDAYVSRAREVNEMRQKDGRVISAANKTKLQAMYEAMQNMMPLMEELIAAAEPKSAPALDPAQPSQAEVQKALADFLKTQFDYLLTGA